jgi:hypothetical protein
LIATVCHTYVTPETAVGCKVVKSTVVAGHALLLLVVVGTGVLGVALTVIVVVAAADIQPETVCVKLTVYVPADVLVNVLLAVVPDTVPATEAKLAPVGATVQV